MPLLGPQGLGHHEGEEGPRSQSHAEDQAFGDGIIRRVEEDKGAQSKGDNAACREDAVGGSLDVEDEKDEGQGDQGQTHVVDRKHLERVEG